MKSFRRCLVAMMLVVVGHALWAETLPSGSIKLSSGWQLQSSATVKDSGATLSSTAYQPATSWQSVTVPTTVVAALVKNKVLPDPYFGKNLRSFPGMGYPSGINFSNLPMPADSPYKVPWWYRTEFQLPAAYKGKTISLKFEGINYRANIWLNGKRIASSDQVAGAYRSYEFNVSDTAVAGGTNVLAVEVFPPTEHDLAITFVDWNPAPPDKNMGLWRSVYVLSSGPVSVRHPFVESEIDLPAATQAKLTVNAELRNNSDKPVSGTLKGKIGDVAFSQAVELKANELKQVTLTSDQVPELNIKNPRLWWPAQMGKPELYTLELEFVTDGQVSDAVTTSFGIRKITSELNQSQHRVFQVNGKNILIRGGGWASDMMLRENPQRLEQEIRYAQDMGLNTIRLEGKLEPDEFFDITDRLGMLVIAGWCCCDHWEKWDKWKPEDHTIAEESQRSQIKRLRNRPSMLLWMNGSDNPPPAPVETMYLSVLKECKWPNPSVSSATATPTKVSGESGVKMTGPYEYVAPSYWLEDTKKGGAWGFNTETSPGPAVPPIESVRKMLPPDKLWPINDYWDYHAGGHEFVTIKRYTEALNRRYGKTRSAEEFTAKAQAVNYEGIRAMFEAYGRNKYRSSGVIQWMLNNAWPGMIWHLYDYYLLPGGGYFGAKKANEPLHAQYSYDDGSVWVVSSQYTDSPGLKLTAKVYDLNMTEKFSRTATVDAKADSTNNVFSIPPQTGMTPTYFVVLTLADPAGKTISSNLYWLSTAKETLAWDKTKWFVTPTRSFADFTALDSLPRVRLKQHFNTVREGDELRTTVTLENPSKSIAFLVRLKANKGKDGEEILPVFWEDNYISLLPGEKRVISARYAAADAGNATPHVTVQGWNVETD